MNIDNAASIVSALTGIRFQKSECGKQLIGKAKKFPQYTITSNSGSYSLTYCKYDHDVVDMEITINEISRRINFLETGDPILERE